VTHNNNIILQDLQELCLVWCSQITDAVIDSLRSIDSLKMLELAGCGISEEGASVLRDGGLLISR
jgi:hypothetical protein